MGWVGIELLLWVVRLNTTKVRLSADDLCGTYRIDNTAWLSRQADWQYQHYTLQIDKSGTLSLMERYDGGGNQVFTIPYRLNEGYVSAPRLISRPDIFTHHIIQDNPTLYRGIWDYHYVFYSPKYGNVFFRKQRWWE